MAEQPSELSRFLCMCEGARVPGSPPLPLGDIPFITRNCDKAEAERSGEMRRKFLNFVSFHQQQRQDLQHTESTIKSLSSSLPLSLSFSLALRFYCYLQGASEINK